MACERKEGRGIAGAMTIFAKLYSDRTLFIIQFGPLTCYRKEKQGYMDVKIFFLGGLGHSGG
jgi:hypothetical protein